jgi:hypothetical protein
LVRESWPPQSAPATEREAFQRRLIDEYEIWMTDIQGHAAATRKGCRAEAQRFLSGLGRQARQASLSAIGVSDLDACSARSTMVYLKLATQELRAVALDVPGGVSP